MSLLPEFVKLLHSNFNEAIKKEMDAVSLKAGMAEDLEARAWYLGMKSGLARAFRLFQEKGVHKSLKELEV